MDRTIYTIEPTVAWLIYLVTQLFIFNLSLYKHIHNLSRFVRFANCMNRQSWSASLLSIQFLHLFEILQKFNWTLQVDVQYKGWYAGVRISWKKFVMHIFTYELVLSLINLHKGKTPEYLARMPCFIYQRFSSHVL